MSVIKFLLCCLFFFSSEAASNATNYPIILVPGIGGSQIHAKLFGTNSAHFYCEKKTPSFYVLWLDLLSIFPFTVDCFIENIQLEFNEEVNRTRLPFGVVTYAPGWGHTENVEWLSSFQTLKTDYFFNLVQNLVEKHGYKRNESVRGGPYDFRFAPDDQIPFFHNLKSLVEETSRINDGKPVIILGHSMGGLFTLHFLQGQTQEWKNRYIRSFISAAVPYGGAVSAMQTFLAGDNVHIPIVKPIWFRKAQRSWPSTTYLFPKRSAWGANDVLIQTSERNYTLDEIHQIFQDAGDPLGQRLYSMTTNLTDGLEPPGVEVHCILNNGLDTPVQLNWSGLQFPDDSPQMVMGDGDGTVSWNSLSICSKWADRQSAPVFTKVIERQPHLDMVKMEPFIDYVSSVATNTFAR